MAGCEAKLSVKGRGRGSPLQLRPCGMRAIVKTPPGFFGDGREVWFCAKHAPSKLLLPASPAQQPNEMRGK